MATRTSIIISSTQNENPPSWDDADLQVFLRHFISQYGIRATGDLLVSEADTPANKIKIAAGVAFIGITKNSKDYGVRFENIEAAELTIAANSSGNPRKDLIVARIDVEIDPDENASNIGILEVIAGTPSGSPEVPDTPANAIALAVVDVANGQTEFLNEDITDAREQVLFDKTFLDLVKNDVGLSLVDNFATATKAQAEAGLLNTVFMTALRVKEAILAQIESGLPIVLSEDADGTTTPLAMVLNWTGSAYERKATKSDDKDENKIKFLGFLSDDISENESASLKVSGVQGGFSDLEIGADYFLKNISGTPFNLVDQSAANTEYAFGYNTSSREKIGQTFTNDATKRNIGRIKVNLKKTGTPSGEIVGKLYAADKTTILGISKNSFESSDFTTSFQEFSFEFSGELIAASTVFFFVLEIIGGTLSTSNYYQVEASSSDPYSGGAVFAKSVSWTELSSYDFKMTIETDPQTKGHISTSQGMHVVKIGKAISATEIFIDPFLEEGASTPEIAVIDTEYTARSDGIVSCFGYGTGTPTGYVGEATATTKIAEESFHSTYRDKGSFSFPVKKGWKWRVDNGGSIVEVLFTPIS